jgi:hypothetical protein
LKALTPRERLAKVASPGGRCKPQEYFPPCLSLSAPAQKLIWTRVSGPGKGI